MRLLSALAALAMLLPAAASAQRADPAKVVAARESGMKAIGRSFKAVNDQLRGGAPDAAVLRREATSLARLSQALPRWFPRGTGPGAGVKTDAKAEIWTQPQDFSAKARGFQVAAAALQAASAGRGDPAAAARQVGQSCKACHTGYRVDD